MRNLHHSSGKCKSNPQWDTTSHHEDGYYQKMRKCWWGCRDIGTLVQCWQEWKMVQSLWKTVWRHLKKLNSGPSLVAQWLRIGLPMQGTCVQSPAQEDPTFLHTARNSSSHSLQLGKPTCSNRLSATKNKQKFFKKLNLDTFVTLKFHS